jgi:D-beta-D-heptose 7-phosphate kinase/D-beta-D-heptose 1-phosphate adenosyltransferase
MGDVLIVGLNSDTSVSSIKEKRPIIGESERAEVLSALEPVDYITIFDEPEPTSLIRVIEPDVLIKGGDWKQDEIKGAEFAKETKIFPYLSGWSTTEIIERCRRSFLC